MTEPAVTPTAEQLEAVAASPDQGPVVMLNLLRYNDQASDGSGRTGREAYLDYGTHVVPMVLGLGGSIVFQGDAHPSVIGPADERWDEVVLVRYPSRAAFLGMITSAEYLAIHHHREAGLADSRLVPMTPNVV
jgi:uncharacterized protein (DUF1330 family)